MLEMRRSSWAAALATCLLVLAAAPAVRAQTCVPVAAEFVLTGLSALDGNVKNHEVGVCLPHFNLELTAACKLTLKPQFASNAYVSLLQVGEPVPGQPIVPRATDSLTSIHDAVTNKLGYYYLRPQLCPQVYTAFVKGAKLLATDVASLIATTLGVDASVLSSVVFNQFGLTIAWRLTGATPNLLTYTAINKTGGPAMPDFQAFTGSPNSFCPLLDINPAADFDTSPRDGIVDAASATLVGRVPRPIPGRQGAFICAIAPAGGFVSARRSAAVYTAYPASTAAGTTTAAAAAAAATPSSIAYAYTALSPNAYVSCGSGGFLYKLGAVNVPGDGATDSCVACLRGSFAASGASLCRPCPAGQYQDAMGGRSCAPCQYGYAPLEGSQRCMDCFYARPYCSEGYSPNEAAFTCNQARLPAGYSPEGGFSIVRPYTEPTNVDVAMRYSAMFNSCAISPSEATLGLNVSAECRVDMYVMGDLGINGNVCSSNSGLSSVAGVYTAPNILAGMETRGAAGTRVAMYGTLGAAGLAMTFFATSYSAQIPPSLNLPTNTLLGLTYSGWGYLGGGDNGLGQNAGVRGVAADPCPAGSVRHFLNGDGNNRPSEDPNSLLSDYCVPCGPGVYCDGASSSPTNCPAGTHGVVIGAKSSAGCIDCPIGTYQDMDGQYECKICEPDTFASAPGSTRCLGCGDGYEVAAAGSNVCNPCSPGMYRDAAISNKCVQCPAGTASKQAAGQCTVCTPGSFSPAPKSSECTPCPRGSFQGKYGQKACLPCNKGMYQDSRGEPKCKVCPAGAFNAKNGSVAATDCLLCPAGTAGTQPGAAKCTPCNPGYFTSRNGLSSCMPCQMGSFAAKPGSSMCSPCPKGSFTDKPGSTACKPCAIGFFAAFPGSSKCSSCPAGSFTNATGANVCVQCPAGTYSTRAAAGSGITCVACPPGSFSYAKGSTQCTPCPAGQFTSKAGAQSCRDCPLASYSTSEGSARCLPCKAGFTATSTGSISASACNVKIALNAA